MTGGTRNTAVGSVALRELQTNTNDNTAIGYSSLGDCTTGSQNTGVGGYCADSITTGGLNTAIGYQALKNNLSGDKNTAIGRRAGFNTTGDNNTYLGEYAGGDATSGDNNVCLGHNAQKSAVDAGGEFVLGSSTISTLRCNTQTISALSDRRDKTNIIDLPQGLDFINALRPVKFQWQTRDGNNKDGLYEHGFIAQDLQTAEQNNNAEYLNMVLTTNPDRLEASYGKLVPILVKAVQELTIKLNTLIKNG
jgi:hypothetical protein